MLLLLPAIFMIICYCTPAFMQLILHCPKYICWIDHIELYYLYCLVKGINRGERFKLSFSSAVFSNQLSVVK